MFDFLHPLKQLWSPFDDDRGNWASSRSRAMLLGLPALAAISIAIVFLIFTQVGREKRLESWYKSLLETAKTDLQAKSESLSAKQILLNNLNDEGQRQDIQDQILTLENELANLKDKVQVFLSKLIDLNSENLDYTFQLAMAYSGTDDTRQNALLATMAPEDEPVYFRAHVHMAEYFFREAMQATSIGDKKFFLEKARIQADHCLTEQANHRKAMDIKAAVFQQLEQYPEAAELLNKLFLIDVRYYRNLAFVNEKLGKDNTYVLDATIKRFIERQNNNTENDTRIWVECWDNLVYCWTKLKKYQTAAENLEAELKRQENDPVRQKFLRSKLAMVYTGWAASEKINETANSNLEQRDRAFQRLVSAYKYDKRNRATLKMLAWYVANDEDFGPSAKQIYDPYQDPDPPADVLSELGVRALQLKEFERAIKLFQRARDKESRNPALLNNLAYALLASQNTEESAEEALALVEDGLQILRVAGDPLNQATNLLDTRGDALMQLNRIEDAIASYEQALQWRPDNQEIIESLIRCYEGTIDEQAQAYNEYLDELRKRTEQNTSSE